jgi:hypothetical protein
MCFHRLEGHDGALCSCLFETSGMMPMDMHVLRPDRRMHPQKLGMISQKCMSMDETISA